MWIGIRGFIQWSFMNGFMSDTILCHVWVKDVSCQDVKVTFYCIMSGAWTYHIHDVMSSNMSCPQVLLNNKGKQVLHNPNPYPGGLLAILAGIFGQSSKWSWCHTQQIPVTFEHVHCTRRLIRDHSLRTGFIQVTEREKHPQVILSFYQSCWGWSKTLTS